MINPVTVIGLLVTVSNYGIVYAETEDVSNFARHNANANIVQSAALLATNTQLSEVPASVQHRDPILYAQLESSLSKSSKVATDSSLTNPPVLSATVLLNEMVSALQELNYQGTVVYSHDGIVESMQVVHRGGAKTGDEIERVVQLNGVPREVIRKNDVVTCYMSGTRSVLVGKQKFGGSLFTARSTKFANFSDTYRFSLKGVGRVAGKPTRIIDIQPMDKYRYGYKLWLSSDNALLLKSELVGTDGKVLERIMFVQMEVLDSIPDAMLKPSISGELFTWHQDKAKPNSDTVAVQLDNWLFSTLPAGFKISAVSKQQMPNSDMPADHVVITDGLASISVYIEAFGVQSQPFVGSSRMGAVNIYGVVIRDHQVTVVGEVPELTVKLIAESVQSVNTGADG